MNVIKLFTWGIILFPVLNLYGVGIPGFSVGKLFLLIIIVVNVVSTRSASNIRIPRNLSPFAYWMLLIPFIYCFSDWIVLSSLIYKFIGVLGFWVTIAFSYRLFDWSRAVKYYEKSVVVFSVIFLIQTVVYFTTNINLSFIIPGLSLADASDSDFYVHMQSSLQRQCSVFLEPAHFSVYISIYLILALRKSKGLTTNFGNLIFISVVMLLTRSGNAYLALVIIYGLYFLLNIRTIFTNKKGLMLLLICFFFAIPIYNRIKGVEEFDNSFGRVAELRLDGEQSTSGFERVYKGYYYYDAMDPLAKIIGTGQGNIEAYTASHMDSRFGSLDILGDSLYFNGIQQVLIYGGMFGLLLFVWGIFPYVKNPDSRITILLYLAFCFISSTYNSSTMLMFLLFADALRRNSIRRIRA